MGRVAQCLMTVNITYCYWQRWEKTMYWTLSCETETEFYSTLFFFIIKV